MADTVGLAHSWEAERTLLGAILTDSTLLVEVTRVVSAEDFHRPTHRATFELMLHLGEQPEPFDRNSVFEEASLRGLETFGGAQYLLGLEQSCVSVEGWIRAAQMIRRLSFAREVKLSALRLVESIDRNDLPDVALAAHETALLGMRRPTNGRDGWISLGLTAEEQFNAYLAREASDTRISGTMASPPIRIAVAFAPLDEAWTLPRTVIPPWIETPPPRPPITRPLPSTLA